MVDLKRLIESMELCKSAERDCHKCMYCETENDCRDSMIYDAVELLKEQEQEKSVYTWMCPECDSQIILKSYKANKAIGMSFNCCPVCGKKALYGKAD